MGILDEMAELANQTGTARFRKEAMYSGRKMAGRVSAKNEKRFDAATEAAAPSFLRRKRGEASFGRRSGEDKPFE